MAIKLVREFQQKQQVAITPQLKKSIDLLQLSRVEIISKIHAEAEDNPFLIKESEVDVSLSNISNDELIANLPEIITLQDHLKIQINDLNLEEPHQKIAILLIQSLDESGLLQFNVDELEDIFNNRIDLMLVVSVG